MGIVVAFFLGVGFAIFILSLMRASSSSDQLAEAYWEGYRHGIDDAEAGTVRAFNAAGKSEAQK